MNNKRLFTIFLLVMFCSIFLLTDPTGVIGEKRYPFLGQKTEKDVDRVPVIDERLPRETTEDVSSSGKIPYRPNPANAMPRLGEVKEYKGLMIETVMNPKTGKPMTVAADHIVVIYNESLYDNNRGKAVYDKLEAINKKFGTEIIESSYFRGRYEKLSIPRGETKLTLINKLNNDPNVKDAHLDPLMLPHWTPNDPNYDGLTAEQWHIQSYIASNLIQGGACNLPGGWDLMGVGNYGGDPNVRIANLDTGSAYDNVASYLKSPEFGHFTNVYATVATISAATYVTPSILVATDAQSDTANNDTDPYPHDCEGHGTDTTAIHSATGNNAAFVSGIAWECSLIPVKVLPGFSTDTADGIDYAVSMGADVINMSLGGPTGSPESQTANNAAWAAGVFIAASSGNDYAEVIGYPAAYINVFAVGMVESNGDIACPTNEPILGGGSDHNDGSTAGFQEEQGEIEVMAGGGSGDTYKQFISFGFDDGDCPTSVNDFTIQPPPGWVSFGTSYSCPVVSGVAALMVCKGGTNSQIRYNLRKTCVYLDYDPANPGTPFTTYANQDIGDGTLRDYNRYYGFGLIDAQAAIQLSAPAPNMTIAAWDEDSSGDSIIEPGESNKDFVITLENVGTANALNVTLDILTDDYFTSVTNNIGVSYGGINVSATADNSGAPVKLSVASDCPIPRDIEFDVVVRYEDAGSIEYSNYLTVKISCGKFDVIVFDVDGGDTGGTDDIDTNEAITEALTSNGFNYTFMKDYLPTDISGNHVQTILIAQGNINIRWSSGGYFIEPDWGQLEAWLAENSGHNLYIEGVGIGRTVDTDGDWNKIGYYDNQSGTPFYSDYLHAQINTSQDSDGMYDKGFDVGTPDGTDNVTTLLGQSSTIAAGLNYGTNVKDSMGDSFNNHLTAVNGGVVVFRNQADNVNLAIQYDGGANYKVVYQELLLCCFNDGLSTKADYISSVMNFFGYGYSVSDVTPPAKVDITATLAGTTPGQLVLKWTAPGDDGYNGRLADGVGDDGYYEIQYKSGVTDFTWDDAGTTQIAGPTPGAPYSAQNKIISSLTLDTTYAFKLRAYDDKQPTGNYSESDATSIHVEAWCTGCEYMSSLSVVALVEWQDPGSLDCVNEWKTQFGAKGVLYDFYSAEMPASLTNYDAVFMINGTWVTEFVNEDTGYGVFIFNEEYREAVRDYVTNDGGAVYFEGEAIGMRSVWIDEPLVGIIDDTWLPEVFGYDPEDTNGTGSHWLEYYWFTTDEGYFKTAGYYQTGADFGGTDWAHTPNPGYQNTMIPANHLTTATVSYLSNTLEDEGPPVLTGQCPLIIEYEVGTSSRIMASINMFNITEKSVYVDDIISYYGLGVMPSVDTCPPTDITDLKSSMSGQDLKVRLQWTAPGDDTLLGTGIGTCTTYDIRYRTDAPVTDGNWTTATALTGEDAPSIFGASELWNTTTLPGSGTYYFAMKAIDDAPNTSNLSNSTAIYVPSATAAPKVIVYSRVGAMNKYPYDGVRDDFEASTRAFDPILIALDELGIAYDLYIWDFPPLDPGPTNPLLKYDVMFICGAAEYPTADPMEGCMPYDDTFYIQDFLANGGRLYQEEARFPSVYGDDYVSDLGWGIGIEAKHWPYFGIMWDWFRAAESPCEMVTGTDGSFSEDMAFFYDANGPLDWQPSIHTIAETGARGINAFPIFITADDPLYPNNTYPLEITTWIGNDTVGAKTIAANEYFGAFSSYTGTYPNSRTELMRRILQFFDFGGVEVFSTTEPILFPAWSNDGRDVAFINGDYGSADIMVVQDAGIEGSPTTVNITNVGVGNLHHMSSITWSSDDQYLLFVSSSALYPKTFRVKADNTLAAQVWQPTASVVDWWGTTINVPRFIDPDWSHGTINGEEKIVASLFGELWTYNADGSGVGWGAVQLTDFQQGKYFVSYSTNSKVFQPKWSPTDDEVVFVYRPPGTGVALTGIYILSDVQDIVLGNTNPPTTLGDSRISAIYPIGFYPAWSPSWTHDGSYVAFCVDKAKAFNNVEYWTNPNTEIQASNFDVVFREANLNHNIQYIQETTAPEGFEEWSYSGGDKYVYISRSDATNKYGLYFHGPEALEGSGITRGVSKNDMLVVNDRSKSYVKMSTSGYADVKLSIKTPTRIKSNGTNGLTYVGEAREIKTYPGAETFRNGAELVIHYTKPEAEGLNQRSFGIYYFDKNKNAWTPIIGSVVTTYENGGYVSAKVYKQGTYAIFTGKKASAYEDLTEMRIFPNPYRPNDGKALTGTKVQGIVIDRLPDDIDEIKVYNVAGDLVATNDNGAVHYFEQSDPNWIAPYLTVDPNGAIAIWYGNNDNDKRVASGVYLITIKTTSGHEEVKKVAVIW